MINSDFRINKEAMTEAF